jgi:membrane fusion protein, multidrug efflux system
MLRGVAGWLAAIGLTVLLSACGGSSSPQQTAGGGGAVSAQVETVREQTLPIHASFPGSVASADQVQVASRLMGYVQQVHVHEGEQVTKGQLLLSLDPTNVRGSIDQARAAVAKAKAALAEARTKFDRYQALYAQKAVPKQQFQQIETGYQVAKGDHAAAVAALAKANAELSYAEVRAPFAGVVVDKLIDAGQLAAPGQQLLTLQSAGHLQVHVQVDTEAFNHLRLGQRVVVIVDRGDGKVRRLEGTVERLVQAADPMTHTHSVKIGLPPQSPVQSGTYARVQIDVGARQGIVVPPSAVHRRAGIEGVFVVDREGLAAFRMVRLGERFDGGVVVLAGLVPGDRVIVGARGELDNGVRIKADGA